MTPFRRALAALLATLGTLVLLLVAAPGAAAIPLPDIPGVPDCKEAPTPEVPGRGVVGFFESAPKELPPAGDPFAPNTTTTIHEQYGYAGLRFNTYDLGCGPDLARSPDASIGTSVSNWILTFPKTMVAATGAIVGAAFQPDFLGVFDPLVTQVVETLRSAVFEQWIFLTIAAVGLLLVWRARQASLASSTAAVGWALFVLVVATMVFRWPLVAGTAADDTVTTTLGAVSAGLNGETAAEQDDAGEAATAGMHQALLYQAWLGGTFGDSNSEVARRYGSTIFQSQALTWREAQVLKDDPGEGRKIIEAKQKAYEQTAEKIKNEDPDAYEYLTGKRSDTRVGYALLAGFAALCAVPFLLVAGLLVLGALIIVRFGIMLFPAFATLGLFPTMRGLVIGIGNTMAAALINAVVFGIGAAVTVKAIGVLLAPSTGLAPWLDVVLVLLLTLVMWVALRPFRRLSSMVSRNRNHFASATGAAGNVSRGVARAGGRILTTAFGTFLGTAAANRAQEDDKELMARPGGVPQRAEAITSYQEPAGDGAGAGQPVEITAGNVTVNSPVAESAAAVAAGAGVGAAAGAAASRGTAASRVESSSDAGTYARPAATARAERAPAIAASSGTGLPSRNGVVVDRSRGTAADNGGRFEAGGTGGTGRRAAPARGSGRTPTDLSDYEFDELADIFRPEPEAPSRRRPPVRPQPAEPTRSEGRVEAGRGR